MSNENTEDGMGSRPEWDHLEDWLRGQVQGLIQHVLEEEVTEFPGQGEVGTTVGLRTATVATGTGTHVPGS